MCCTWNFFAQIASKPFHPIITCQPLDVLSLSWSEYLSFGEDSESLIHLFLFLSLDLDNKWMHCVICPEYGGVWSHSGHVNRLFSRERCWVRFPVRIFPKEYILIRLTVSTVAHIYRNSVTLVSSLPVLPFPLILPWSTELRGAIRWMHYKISPEYVRCLVTQRSSQPSLF